MANLTSTTGTDLPCHFVHGNTKPLQQWIYIWRLPGYAGYGAQQMGKGASSFSYTAVKYGTVAVVQGWINVVASFSGTIISLVDDWDVTHSNLLVRMMTPPIRTPAVVPGTVTVMRAEITLVGVVTA